MHKRLISLLLSLMLLPLLAASEAPVYQVFTFASDLPQQLEEPLGAFIPDETQVLSGAAIQHNGSHYSDHPTSLDSYTAIVLVSADAGPRLYAAAWVENLPWQVNDYSRFLRQTKNVSVSIYQPEPNRLPVFSVNYSVQGGSKSDLFLFRSNKLWAMQGHLNPSDSLSVMNRLGYIERTEGEGRKQYACSNPFFLDYLKEIADFPVSREACEAMVIARETASAQDAAANRVYASDAHLRTAPTSKSESLGIYATNAPMIFTGAQQPGTLFPWYQVRVGHVTGWMSSNYVTTAPDPGFDPIRLGRTPAGCPLYETTGDAQPTAQLEPGTTFHILTEYKGMYHICIPRAELSWAVDPEGTYGYIPMQDVLTGYSPSALDAAELYPFKPLILSP